MLEIMGDSYINIKYKWDLISVIVNILDYYVWKVSVLNMKLCQCLDYIRDEM